MIGAVSFGLFISISLLIVNYSLMKRAQNIYIQKLNFFHNSFTEDNFKHFKMYKNFKVSLLYNDYSVPDVIERYFENYYYRITIEKFERHLLISKITNYVLLISAVSCFLIAWYHSSLGI